MPRHHIFLSYSRQDSDFVFDLHDRLRKEGLSVWIDREGIQPGTPSWRKTIQDAIDEASCLLVVLSPAAKTSHWVGEELTYGQTQGKRVFYVLARGDERTAVPFGYSAAQWIDMRDAATYDTCFAQLAGAVFDFLQIDSDVFKQERLRIEEEGRRVEREERERRAREEAQRIAAESAAQRQSSPGAVVGVAPVEPRRSSLPAVQRIWAGYSTTAPDYEIAGLGTRLLAALLDTGVIISVLVVLYLATNIYVALVVSTVIALFYHMFFWTWFNGQTPGKMLTGIRVVTVSGEPVSAGCAFARYIGFSLDSLSGGLGFLLAFVNSDQRMLHDFVAGTRVIKIR